jgi:hypothetical protein
MTECFRVEIVEMTTPAPCVANGTANICAKSSTRAEKYEIPVFFIVTVEDMSDWEGSLVYGEVKSRLCLGLRKIVCLALCEDRISLMKDKYKMLIMWCDEMKKDW